MSCWNVAFAVLNMITKLLRCCLPPLPELKNQKNGQTAQPEQVPNRSRTCSEHLLEVQNDQKNQKNEKTSETRTGPERVPNMFRTCSVRAQSGLLLRNASWRGTVRKPETI